MQLFLRFFRQAEEEFLRRERHAHAEHRHLDQPLVIIDDLAPVFGVFRIDARDDALFPLFPQGRHALTVPREHRHDRPQWTRKRFHLRDVIRIHRAGIAQMQSRLIRAEQRQKRLDQLNGSALNVLP